VKVAVVKAGAIVVIDFDSGRIKTYRYDQVEAERGEDFKWTVRVKYNGSEITLQDISDVYIERWGA